MSLLIVAEHQNNALKSATLHTLNAAVELDKDITILIAGHECNEAAIEAAQLANVTRVLKIDALIYQHQLAENLADLIAKIGHEFNYILAPATTFGKNLLPRVAALLDVALISDIIGIVAADTFIRPIYAGNAIATVQSQDKIKMITVRTTAFPAAKSGTTTAPIDSVAAVQALPDVARSEFVGHELNQSTRPELTAARIVISGGRGLQSGDNFKLLEALADQLGAAIGASRAAVDAGFVPNDYQVGQTGKVVAPDLYFAIGISGAIQHVAGMKDSKIIVAINKDADAPIFQIADYGLVGDLFTILPELTEVLRKKN